MGPSLVSKNDEGLLYPGILPLWLCCCRIFRYKASKRGRDFWHTLYNINGFECARIN